MVRDHRSASTIRNHRREPQEAVWGGLLCVPDVLIPISSSGNGGIGQHAAGQGAPQHRERRRSGSRGAQSLPFRCPCYLRSSQRVLKVP